MKSLILLATLIYSQVSFASGNHYHPKQILKCTSECTEAEVKGILPAAIDTLVKKQKKYEKLGSKSHLKKLKKDNSKA